MNIFLIGVGGKKESGKDTLARILVSRLRAEGSVQIVRFATAIKGMALIDWCLPGAPKPQLEDFIFRWPLIDLGNKGRKLEQDLWIKTLLVSIWYGLGKGPKNKFFIIPDVRFINEARFIKNFKSYCNELSYDKELFNNEHEPVNVYSCLIKIENCVRTGNGVDTSVGLVSKDSSETESSSFEFRQYVDFTLQITDVTQTPKETFNCLLKELDKKAITDQGARYFYQILSKEAKPNIFVSFPISYNKRRKNTYYKLVELLESNGFNAITPYKPYSDEESFLSGLKKGLCIAAKEIWLKNMMALAGCDGVLVYMPRPSIGVTEELIFGNLLNKLVVVISGDHTMIHPTINIWNGQSHFRSIPKAIEFLKTNLGI